MKKRYRLIRRGDRNSFYCFNTLTRKRETLRTSHAREAERLVAAMNEADSHASMNLQIAQIYLQHSDSILSKRTWQQVMETIVASKTGSTLERWSYAIEDKAFDLIRNLKLVETTAEHFLAVLKSGSVSTNVYLRRAHNFAIGMHWLPWPVLPPLRWPHIRYKEKRAITLDEHQQIIERERNPELKAYYQLLWHLGGAQTDIANLNAQDIDWTEHTICYHRRKTQILVLITFGAGAQGVLRTLPTTGPLFPRLIQLHEKHRAKLFAKRLATVSISGVSLHSYRYAWAIRAKECGYPERFAMQALGHNSKAVHRAYARQAKPKLPSLEEYEKKIIQLRVPKNHSPLSAQTDELRSNSDQVPPQVAVDS